MAEAKQSTQRFNTVTMVNYQHMKKLTLWACILLPAISIHAQIIPVYTEHFTSYDNVWKQCNNESGTLSVTDSKYKIGTRLENGQWLHTIENKKIDAEHDFTIEAAMMHTGGAGNQFYGITYGHSDDGNAYNFCISEEGKYAIIKNEQGTTEELASGTALLYINKADSAVNVLKITKTNGNCMYYVNHSLIATLPFTVFFGPNLGFAVAGTQSVEVDYLSIAVELPNTVTGIAIPDGMVNILNEEFDATPNGWSKKCSSGSFNTGQGRAIVKCSGIGRCCSVYTETSIHQQGDFIVEALVSKTDGASYTSFGLMSGSENMEISYEWFLQSTGAFGFYVDYSGDTYDTPEVNTYNAPNMLSIYKTGNLVKFYINGKEVFTTDYIASMFDEIGFVVCDPGTIAVENIQIWETKP